MFYFLLHLFFFGNHIVNRPLQAGSGSAAKRFSEKLIFGREAKLRGQMINLPQYQFISCKSLKEDKKF